MSIDAELERHLPFDTVFNFRDLGGYQAADGRTVRWRRVFRADGLYRITGDDLARLAELGVRTVIDLRSPLELEERGRFGTGEGHETVEVRYHHLPVIDAAWTPASFDGSISPERYLADRYLEMLEEGRDALGTGLGIIADPGSLPLVFHCAAGKDRTGVLAALTLSLLGVDDDTVAQDYGLSSLAMERMEAWVRATRPERLELVVNQPSVFVASPVEAMHLFLDGLRGTYGSVEAYAASVGLDDDALDSLRAHLLT
jgi:protein-tyrosine phosphatase